MGILDSDSEDSSDDSSGFGKKKPAAAFAPPKKSRFSDSSSDSSSSSGKKTPAAPAPPPPRKKSALDSSSEESGSTGKKKPAPPPPPAAPAAKKMDDSDDSSVTSNSSGKMKAKTTPTSAVKSNVSSSSSSSSSEQKKQSVRPSAPSPTSVTAYPDGALAIEAPTQQLLEEEKQEIVSLRPTSSSSDAASQRSPKPEPQEEQKQQLSPRSLSSRSGSKSHESKTNDPKPNGSNASKGSKGSHADGSKTGRSQSNPNGSQYLQTQTQRQPPEEQHQQVSSPPVPVEVSQRVLPNQEQIATCQSSLGSMTQTRLLPSRATQSTDSLEQSSRMINGELIEENGVLYHVFEEVIEEGNQASENVSSVNTAALQHPKQAYLQQARKSPSVRFRKPHVTDLLEYRQDHDAPLSVNVAVHVAKDHNEIPWYQHDYDELPWYMQPDLKEDDALTALGKKVLLASEDGELNLEQLEGRGVRLEDCTITLAQKVRNLRDQRKQQHEKQAATRTLVQNKQGVSNETSPASENAQVDYRVVGYQPTKPVLKSSNPAMPSPSISHSQRVSSSLLVGPASVLEGGSQKSEISGGSRLAKQKAFLIQSERPSWQNIPPIALRQEAVESGNPRLRSIVESITRRKSESAIPSESASLATKPLKNLGLEATNHVSHPSRQKWSVVDSGFRPSRDSRLLKSVQQQLRTTSQQQKTFQYYPTDAAYDPRNFDRVDRVGVRFQDKQLQEHQHPKPRGISTLPTSQQPMITVTSPFHSEPMPLLDIFELSSSSSKSDDPTQALPIYARVFAQRIYHEPPKLAPSKLTPSKVARNLSTGTQSTVQIVEDDISAFSVPFDEPERYSKEVFQDEYDYERIKKSSQGRAKKTKHRKVSTKVSRDPPAETLRDVDSRPGPDGMNSFISDVGFPNDNPLARQMSALSNVSSISGIDYDPPINYDFLQRIDSFPPLEMEGVAEKARKQHAERDKIPHLLPGSRLEDFEEFEEQKKFSRNSETIYADDHFHSLVPSSRRDESKVNVQGIRQGLSEEERNRLIQKNSSDDSGLYQKNVEPAKQDFSRCYSLAGLFICLGLVVVLLVILIATVRDTAGNGGSGEGASTTAPTLAAEGGETDSTGAPTHGVPSFNPPAAPTPRPIETPIVDGAELLPSYTWDVIQSDNASPQREAWEWLLLQDLDGYSDEELLQRYAVVTFYFATEGNVVVSTKTNNTEESHPPEDNRTMWIRAETHECTWYDGIICNEQNVVQQFLFRQNSLDGSIPAEMGILTNIFRLDLGQNPNLRGTIPPQLGLLTSLLGLDLHESDLTGAIPSEFGLLTNLTWLTLANQDGSGGANTTRHAGKRKLSSTIPTQIGQLTKLEYLRLEDNRLSGPIPNELGNLSSLQTLVLRRNLLTGTIPPYIGKLLQLQGLALDSNQLTEGIPDELLRLPNLIELHLKDNEMKGYLPAALDMLSNSLTWLTLSNNAFVGPLPVAWYKLSKLQIMQLEGNAEVTGTIPVEWGIHWAQMVTIGLHGTSLKGEVPLGLCFLNEEPEYPLESITVDCDAIACSCSCKCA